MKEGTRVRLTRDVERYPHFVAPEGAEGTITKSQVDLVAVRLDERLDGAEEWDNEIQWFDGMAENTDFREVFQQDVEVLETS